ncbi:MAG TPA: 2'-5' RNA ligase family protein [Candidatus Limnocylindrales bacterium]|nr:2'-5' RNA ligase family protein [Candidatus Limnocylindrales bacterium]
MVQVADRTSSGRSAVILPIRLPPELEAVHSAAVGVAALGVPAHVTLLFPWLEPEAIGSPDIATLRRVVGGEPAFDLVLVAARAFPRRGDQPGTTYLVPEPAEPCIRLTRAIWAAFPDHPPYEGAFEAVVPHLTVADDAARLEEVARIAEVALPAKRWVSEAWLIVEGEGGRWARRARLALGRSNGRRPRAGR